MDNSAHYLFLASGVKNGEGFWIVGVKNCNENVLEDKTLLDCHRKELIGYQSAKDIIFAIKLNIENLLHELRNKNYLIESFIRCQKVLLREYKLRPEIVLD